MATIEFIRNLPRPTRFSTIEDAQRYIEMLVSALEQWHIEVPSVDTSGNINITGSYKVDGTQVVSNRVVDARLAAVSNSGDATTDGLIDAVRDAIISHGLGSAT